MSLIIEKLVKNVKDNLDVIDVVPEEVKNDMKKEEEKRKKEKASKARTKTLAKKKIKEIEAKILLSLIPDNIETDDDFPLFFPITESKKHIKVIASNSLFEFNNKIKEFMSNQSNQSDGNYFYSRNYDFIKESYERFQYLYNNNSITFLHLGGEKELLILHNIDDEIVEIMKELIPELRWDIITKDNDYNDSYEIKNISRIISNFKIKNSITIKNTPKYYKVFWKN